MGLGAYTTAILTTRADSLPSAGLAWRLALADAAGRPAADAGGGRLLGAITLKLSGHFLPLGTIAWGLSLYFAFGSMEGLGGHTGIPDIPAISLFGKALDQGETIYYLTWAFLLLAVWSTRNLLDSREGRAIRALKGGRVMAESMGVDTARSRMVIFIIAALQACASGWLYAHMQRFVNPNPFGLQMGIEYLFMTVIGGAGGMGRAGGRGRVHRAQAVAAGLAAQGAGPDRQFRGHRVRLRHGAAAARAQRLWPLLTRWVPVRKVERKLDRTPRRCRANPCRRAGGAQGGGRDPQVRRAGGQQRHEPGDPRGRDPGADRPQRRRQEHHVQPDIRRGHAHLGQVTLLGQQVAGAGARRIARLGLSRTFQHVRLLGRMSVLENVAIGAHLRGHRGVMPAAGGWTAPRNRASAEAARRRTRGPGPAPA